MLLNEIKGQVDAWMDAKSSALKQKQNEIELETKKQIEAIEATYQQQTERQRRDLEIERENMNRENDVRVTGITDLHKAIVQEKNEVLSIKKDIGDTLREQKKYLDEEKRLLNERTNALDKQREAFDRSMTDIKDDLVRSMKKKADTSRVNELQEEIDNVKSKAGRGNMIPLVLSVLAIVLVIAVAIIGMLLTRGQLADAQEKIEQMQSAIDVLSTTPKATPTLAPTPVPTPEPTEEPSEEPTPEATPEPNAYYVITSEKALNQTFKLELEKVSISIVPIVNDTQNDEEDDSTFVQDEDADNSEDDSEKQESGEDNIIDANSESVDRVGTEPVGDDIDPEKNVPGELNEQEADETFRSWQTMLVLTTNDRIIKLSVNDEENATQKGLEWAKELMATASEATPKWYPDHPLDSFAKEHENADFYQGQEDLEIDLSWFDPFSMMVFENKNDGDVIGYIVFSKTSIPEIDEMKSNDDESNETFTWFDRVKLPIDDVVGYVFAKNYDEAKQTADIFMNPEV